MDTKEDGKSTMVQFRVCNGLYTLNRDRQATPPSDTMTDILSEMDETIRHTTRTNHSTVKCSLRVFFK